MELETQTKSWIKFFALHAEVDKPASNSKPLIHSSCYEWSDFKSYIYYILFSSLFFFLSLFDLCFPFYIFLILFFSHVCVSRCVYIYETISKSIVWWWHWLEDNRIDGLICSLPIFLWGHKHVQAHAHVQLHSFKVLMANVCNFFWWKQCV